MASGAAQIDEAALGQEEDVAAVLQGVAVDLGLDGVLVGGVLLEPFDVDLAIEMADIADDGVVGQLLHVLAADDVLAAGGRHNDVGLVDDFLQSGHLVS